LTLLKEPIRLGLSLLGEPAEVAGGNRSPLGCGLG
jgi:hypothetical protein